MCVCWGGGGLSYLKKKELKSSRGYVAQRGNGSPFSHLARLTHWAQDAQVSRTAKRPLNWAGPGLPRTHFLGHGCCEGPMLSTKLFGATVNRGGSYNYTKVFGRQEGMRQVPG